MPPLSPKLCSMLKQPIVPTFCRESNLLNILTELLRDKEKSIRRSSVACIGELLFYIATQESQEEEEKEAFSVPTSTVVMLTKCLRAGEDEMVQLYGARLVENISTANTSYAKLFCTQEIARALYDMFLTVQPTSAPKYVVISLLMLVALVQQTNFVWLVPLLFLASVNCSHRCCIQL